MVAIKLPVFAGMVPSVDDRLLADQNAAYALNTWLYSGALDALPVDTELHVARSATVGIAYRIPVNPDEPAYLHNSHWVEFEDPDTDFIRAPIAADQFERYYWASSSSSPRYNSKARMLAGSPPFLLGLPQPGIPRVTANGGDNTPVSRAYVTTLVSNFGEEGPASVPVVVNGFANSTYTISVPGVAASDRGVDRNVGQIRVYRTVTTASGTANYYLIRVLAATGETQTITDNEPDNIVASRTVLESTAWTAPPAGLQGFTVMPNGIVAGWVKNELWFSEAYRPHAWPVAYSLALEHNIVGLGVSNQTLVVCTEGRPITASGVNPRSITTATLSSLEPCTSRGSIVSAPEGVYYASPNGLILVNPGVAENITRKVISRDKWTALTGRIPIRAARLGTAYFAFGAGQPLAFQSNFTQANAFQQEAFEGSTDGFMIDAFNENAGFTHLSSGLNVLNVYNDDWSGELLTLKGGRVTWMDQHLGYKMRPYIWRSKVFQSSDKRNFAAFKAWFTKPRNVALRPRDTDINQQFDPRKHMALVRVFADGKLIATRDLLEPGELHRLPSGYKADFWQVEIEAQVRFNSFQMATSVKELSGV